MAEHWTLQDTSIITDATSKQRTRLINNLSFNNHISDIVKSCNYHIRSLRHIRHLIDCDSATTLTCSIVASTLDYCNSVLYGVTDANIPKLQQVQNFLARAVCRLPYGAPVAGMLRELH